MFIKRLGGNAINLCEGGHHCPQFLEMADGAIAVVGTDITDEAIPAMPPGPGVARKSASFEFRAKSLLRRGRKSLPRKAGLPATRVPF